MQTMHVRLSFVMLTLAVLLLAHQLVYLVTFGAPGMEDALSSVGHDAYWLLTAVTVATALGAGVLAGLRRWLILRAAINRLPRAQRVRSSIDWPSFRSSAGRLAPRLALAALFIFFIQENLEHLSLGSGDLPGLRVLTGEEYVGTLPIFALVAGIVATVVSLLRLGLALLERQLESAARQRPEPNPPLPAGRQLPIYPWSRSAPGLGRAPPAVA